MHIEFSSGMHNDFCSLGGAQATKYIFQDEKGDKLLLLLFTHLFIEKVTF